MWELSFMGALVLVGVSIGWGLYTASRPKPPTAEDVAAAIRSSLQTQGWTIPTTANSAFMEAIEQHMCAALAADREAQMANFSSAVVGVSDAPPALTGHDIRRIVLAALEEHRDKAVARVSRRITKRTRKAVMK